MSYQGETHVQILERENSELQAEIERLRELLREAVHAYEACEDVAPYLDFGCDRPTFLRGEWFEQAKEVCGE